jgi:hypothetical protein
MSLMLRSKSDFNRKGSRTGSLSQLRDWDRTYRYFPLFTELSPYHCLSLPYYRVSIFELIATCLNGRMVNTSNGRVIPSPLTQTGTHLRRRPWLKRLLRSLSPVMSRLSCCDTWWPTLASTTCGVFMATHPPLFTEQESLPRPITGFG